MSKSIRSLWKALLIVLAIAGAAAFSLTPWKASSKSSRPATQEARIKSPDAVIADLKQAGAEFPEVDLFTPQPLTANLRLGSQDALKQGAYLNLNAQTALRLTSGDTPNLTLRLPDPAGSGISAELEL